MIDNTDEEQSSQEGMDEIVYDLKYQVMFHTIVSSSLLFVTIVAIAVFMVCLGSAIKTVKELVALKPENRVGYFSSEIDQALKNAEKQYSKYLVKMDDENIFTVSDKFKILYTTSLESEQDNTQLLLDYQQIIYQVASKTKGSGEWYQFYSDGLDRLIDRNKKRAKKIERYVHKDTVSQEMAL